MAMEGCMGGMGSALQSSGLVWGVGERGQYYRWALSDGSPNVKDRGIQGRMGQQLEDKEQSTERWEWWTGDGREGAGAGATLELGANQGPGNRTACPWTG